MSTVEEISEHQRHAYYETVPWSDGRPKSINPRNHTMKEGPFLRYIGVVDVSKYIISSKKFSDHQARALVQAYKARKKVRIIGAPREDIKHLASIYGLTADEKSKMFYDRAGRNSNARRQVMCWMSSDRAKHTELWVFVFPSKQYVDQVAELIQAVFDQFNARNVSGDKQFVTVQHFDKLEQDIAIWTHFRDGAQKFVRFGDVAVIGDLDFLLPGIRAAGFSLEDDWTFFGLDNRFVTKRCVDPTARKQIVLFGFSESFWGQASQYYVEALLHCGARHILYGSKAGNFPKEKNIGKVMAPTSFYNATDIVIRKLDRAMPELVELMRACSIIESGAVVTVPTVIGEDESERLSYDDYRPAVIDCEDSHIATVVQEYNKAVGDEFEYLKTDARFVPVHFITDYIHSSDRKAKKTTPNLADKLTEKKDAFERIGLFFGIYSHRFGLRDNIDVHLSGIQLNGGRRPVLNSPETVMGLPYIDFGLARMRVEFLQYNWRGKPPLQEMATLCKICQISGFARLFLRAYSMIAAERRKIAVRDFAFFQVLSFKILIQRGAWNEARTRLQEIEAVSGWGNLLLHHHELGSLARRKMLLAAQDGERLPLRVDSRVRGEMARYEGYANELFTNIGALYGPPHESLSDLSQKLEGLRKRFYTQSQQKTLMGSEKSALALLFLEAVAYLKWGPRYTRERAFKLLYLAHILNIRVGGNESSELYGEILNSCVEPSLRSLVSLAMRRDDDGVIRIREFMAGESFQWMEEFGRVALESLIMTPEQRGARISDLLTK